MKHLIPQTMTAVSVLALALAVGGCGSSSDKVVAVTDTDTDPVTCGDGTMEQDGQCVATSAPVTCGDGTMEQDGQCVAMSAPADPVPGLFATAQDSKDAAEEAGMMAAGAEKTAMEKSGMLGTMQVAGDSSMAMMNAQAVLDAMGDADQAVMGAQRALDAAEAALATAEADHADNTTLIAALEDAGMVAGAQLKAAMEVADDDAALQMAVDEVTGGEGVVPQGTPRSVATMVGRDIAMSLVPNVDGSGNRARGTLANTGPPDTTANELKVEEHDQMGMTWEMIVGKDNIMMSPLGQDRVSVPVASIMGMTASDVHAGLTATDGENGSNMYADGSLTTNDATYNGIMGTVYCLGTDCEVDDDGKLAGSWYFNPESDTNSYLKNDDGVYVNETLFSVYGHWLTSGISGDETIWTVNTYANSDGGSSYDLTVATTGDTLRDESATYSGKAVGMSVLKMDAADGMGQDIDSGRFTADVTLTAKFGESPTVGGTVDKFTGTSGVNENWTVSLQAATLATDGGETIGGLTVTTGQDGTWSNKAYGNDDGARPAGIFGGFNAHFSDGHASGAYATR